jgi:hypothetical protein
MEDSIRQEIETELTKAKDKYPWWPMDAIHAASIVSEESGELTQAANDHVFDEMNHHGKDTIRRMKKEAIQTAAMAIRFLENMGAYKVE